MGAPVRIWGRRSAFNVQKVLWMLGEVGADFEHVEAGGAAGGLDAPGFLAMNPNGLIPVVEADGVHLGQDDLPVAAARQVLGADGTIGFSTHSESQLVEAQATGADYFAFGPIFATTSKLAADPVLGCERIAAARRLTTSPLVAIGGITAATAPAVLAAGADAVAVIATVVRAPDVQRATAELLELVAGR